MAGDLEDFLRRAAQRRQAKAAQNRGGPADQARARSRPEYTNRKTERLVTPSDADEVLLAEVVEDEADSITARMRRVEAAKEAAAKAELEAARKKSQRPSHGTAYEPNQGVGLSGDPAQDLLKLLRQPGGIKQAILLKEILERPEHRW